MRIVTYNIRGGLGMDGRRSTVRIAEAVRAHGPDIVCFQEVHQRLPWSGLIDQPRRLVRLLGMPVVFQRNLDFGVGGYGIAIASAFPVLETKRHLLPSDKEQRGALEVRLEVPAVGALTVFCTHWGLNGDERAAQAAALAERVNAAPGPVIVCGDLNEGPDAPAVSALLAGTGLRDADAEQNRPTFPAGSPSGRIDYVLYTKGLHLTSIEIDSSLASDHYPVRVDFVPEGRETGL